MIPVLHEPIDQNWTSADSAPIAAADLVAALGGRTVSELRPLHPAIVVVAADLAAAAGIAWPYGLDDPPVAVIRALELLARRSPHVSSALGRSLLAEFPGATPS